MPEARAWPGFEVIGRFDDQARSSDLEARVAANGVGVAAAGAVAAGIASAALLARLRR